MRSLQRSYYSLIVILRPVADDRSIRALRADGDGGAHVISAGIGTAMVGICVFY